MSSRLLGMMNYLSPMLEFNRTRSRKRTQVAPTPSPETESPETESPSPETESPPTRKSTRSTTQRTRKSTRSTTQRTRKRTNPDVIRAVENINKLFEDQRNLKAVLKERLANEEANSKIRTANIKTRAARSAAIVQRLQNMNQISEADYDKAKIEMDKLLADNIRDIRREMEKTQRMLNRMKGGKNSKRSKKIRKYK